MEEINRFLESKPTLTPKTIKEYTRFLTYILKDLEIKNLKL